MDLDITGFVDLFTGWNHSHHCSCCCCCCCCCWRSEDVELSGVRPVIIIVIFIVIVIIIAIIIIIIIIIIITIILGMTCPRRLVLMVGDPGWRPWRRGRR